MKKITLFCAAGMSTSMLVTKMKKYAESKGLELEIAAYPEAEMLKRVEEGLDVALLGPQVGYVLSKAKKICEPKGVPVAVIPSVDYGMMNGEKVVKFAMKLMEG